MKDLIKAPLKDLIAEADRTRSKYIGRKLELCSIINAKSGLCSEDCKFCAQSAHHSTDISCHPLKSRADILAVAREAERIGAARFGIVTSGNRPDKKEIKRIAHAIKDITNSMKLAVCASLGALSKDELLLLKAAGLSRYHHNIETSPGYYSRIVTTHGFKERLDTVKAAKDAGLEVCSGGIIGMGESWEDRIEMAEILKDLDVDSVPINILVPIKGTRLENLEPLCVDDIIRTICIFRIKLRDKTIKIAAGRETALKDFQALGFTAGANGMLIGGYLTVRGRGVEEDKELVKEVERLWAG
ncbi:MAG: biotin synthase BioB [Candidatus Omnitrophica bacterium]|nr:biotin synthase BioB [Candidatus Omnitrophota bacterium]